MRANIFARTSTGAVRRVSQSAGFDDDIHVFRRLLAASAKTAVNPGQARRDDGLKELQVQCQRLEQQLAKWPVRRIQHEALSYAA